MSDDVGLGPLSWDIIFQLPQFFNLHFVRSLAPKHFLRHGVVSLAPRLALLPKILERTEFQFSVETALQLRSRAAFRHVFDVDLPFYVDPIRGVIRLVVRLLGGDVGFEICGFEDAEDGGRRDLDPVVPKPGSDLDERGVGIAAPKPFYPFRDLGLGFPRVVEFGAVRAVEQAFHRPVEPLQPAVKGGFLDAVHPEDLPKGPPRFGHPEAGVVFRAQIDGKAVPSLLRYHCHGHFQ